MVETNGPDRCNTTPNCNQFHTDPPELFGTLQQGCCCNTCTSVRPGEYDEGLDVYHCCRCVPRLMYLQFNPTQDTGTGTGTGLCCAYASVPVVYGGTPYSVTRPASEYTATLFGATVTIKVGRFDGNTGTGSGSGMEDGDCAWYLKVVQNSVTLLEKYVPIDHEARSCLDVEALTLCSVEGPNDCTGELSLKNLDAVHLPFVLRTDIPTAIAAPGTGTAEFIDLVPECGDYGQVCRVLCVTGNRQYAYDVELTEFTWFESTGTGTGLYRGWRNTPTSETIWLKEVANATGTGETCVLEFDFGDDAIPDRTVDPECSCGIKEVVLVTSGDQRIEFVVRCGPCTCWEFYCGTCRCMPKYLCAQTYINNVLTPNWILTWDATAKGWLSSTLATGTGSGEPAVAIYLRKTAVGGCELAASIAGTELSTTKTISCGNEHRSRGPGFDQGKVLDLTNDFINQTWSESPSAGEYVWILISSQVDQCRLGLCQDATPCRDECGSHPQVVYLTLHGYSDSYDGDEPGYDEVECNLSISLVYWEQYDWVSDTLESTCGYIGWHYAGLCQPIPGGLPGTYHTWLKITLSNADLVVEAIQPDIPASEISYSTTLTESCDPYYGEGDVDVLGLTLCAWDCGTTIQRVQATVTE